MSEKYVYHGINITMDIYEKICTVVELLAEAEHVSFEEGYALFISTRLYKVLQIEDSLMWSESAEYILDEYYREVQAA